MVVIPLQQQLTNGIQKKVLRGRVCSFLITWPQNAIESFSFFITVVLIICVSLRSFTDEVEHMYAAEHISL